MNLPGYDEATRRGYAVKSWGRDKRSVTYCKEGVFLRVKASRDGWKAELSVIIRMITITTGWFQFPGRIEFFEKEIGKFYDRVKDLDDV